MSTSAPAVKGKKLPKWFWPVGIGVALILGLYLRNRSSQQQATSSQQTGTSTDVTSNPYYYSGSGAYPDYMGYGTSPYGLSGLGYNGTLDPTSFEEGITYEQQQLGGGLGTITTPSAPTVDPATSAPTPTPVGNSTPGTPGNITINLPAPTVAAPATRVPGRPASSGRSSNPIHSAVTKHKPKAPKPPKRKKK